MAMANAKLKSEKEENIRQKNSNDYCKCCKASLKILFTESVFRPARRGFGILLLSILKLGNQCSKKFLSVT